jgi:NADP-dependent 3-hydroxy acid dehydrogenase YdfG
MALIPNEERRTLILTGASRGIGHATVKRFSSAGWRVIFCSRHPFPEDCPWEAGPEDHIQVDLGDPDNTIRAIAEMKDRLRAQGGRLNALVNNAAISPKGEGGSRLSTIETRVQDWNAVFQVNFFAPLMLARGLMDELAAVSGCVVNVSSIAGSRVHPFAGSAYSTSKAALAALTREMAADFAPRRQGEHHLAWRDRYLDPVAGHREADRRYPDATAWAPGGGGQSHLFPVHRGVELHQRRRAAHQWRPACVVSRPPQTCHAFALAV